MSAEVPLWPSVREVDQRAGALASELPLLSVSQVHGVRRYTELFDKEPRAEDHANYKLATSGDVIVNRMSADKGALGIAFEAGLVSPDYVVLRTSDRIDARYVAYVLKSAVGQSHIRSELRGIGTAAGANVRTPRISTSSLLRLRVPHSPGGGRHIADYLDHETAEIDAFIADLENLGMLEVERRSAAVAAVVWDESTPRFRTKHVTEILSGYPYRSEDFVTEGNDSFRLLRGVNVGVSRIDWSDSVSAPAAVVAVTGDYALREGDLVLGLDRPVIRAGVRATLIDHASAGSYLLQRVARIRGLSSRILNGWLLRALQSRRFVAYLEPDFTGVSVPHISPGQVGEFRVPVPEIDDQRRRLRQIEELETECDTVLADIDAAIALAKERRAALITAAVTGQIDVTAKQVPAVDSIQTAIEESR